MERDHADGVLKLAAEHPDHELLILLAGLSVMWLKPQNPEAVKLLQRCQTGGYPPIALRETALQLFLLAGFQTSLEAMFQIRDVLGIELPSLHDELEQMDASTWLERGQKLQSKVYRDNIVKLRRNLAQASPELAAWTVLVGYGLVLSRPGLPPHWRELLEVVVLAVQGFPRQLHSHLRGALNLGATHEEVELILRVAGAFSAGERRRSAWHMWQMIK